MKKVIDKKNLNLEVEILTDSWFARERLILRAKYQCSFSVITMARKDLALYELAPIRKKGTKGRPRKKGKRIKPEFKDLKKKRILNIYNKEIKVEYKEAICKARFLKYETVKAVWIRFDESQSMRLIISTDTKLSGEEIIKRYAKRWDIEPMFNELKNRFKFKDIMMHNPRSYYQFLYFKIWCFIIVKLSSIQFKNTIIDYVKKFLPWRVSNKKGVTVTAGSTQLALRSIFITLHIRLFFPKMDETINDNFKNNEFVGFDLNEEYQMSG